MADTFSTKERSIIMGKVSGKDTKPEIIVRHFLYQSGMRYRKNYKKLQGTPDIFVLKYNVAIFIHGCFWHGHNYCKHATLPKTNTTYWTEKIGRNISRDLKTVENLALLNIKTVTIWTCEIDTQAKRLIRLPKLLEDIKEITL